MLLKYSLIPRTAPTAKNDLAPNVSNAHGSSIFSVWVLKINSTLFKLS